MAGVTSQGVSLEANSVAIANISSISGPTQSAGQIDVTALDTTGGYREFIAGFRDGGEVTFEFNYDGTATSHLEASTGLKRYFNEGNNETWTLTMSDATVITFDAAVTGLDGPNFGVDEAQTMSATLKVSGVVTMPS